MKDKEFIGYIYCVTNTINNKQYIGQTCRNIRTRWLEHIRHGRNDTDNSYLDRAIIKYGSHSFRLDIIKTITETSRIGLTKLLNEAEVRYIKEYKTIKPYGYNLTSGGGMDGFLYSNIRKVAQYDFDGNLVSVYSSLSEAERINNLCGIYSCCSNKTKNCGKYMWIYVDNNNVKNQIEPYNGIKYHRTLKVDYNGNIMKIYDSFAEASKENDINVTQITECALHKNGRLSAGKYRWIAINYGEDIPEKFDVFIPPRKYSN